MNCSNMPYVTRFFTISVKFFGTFVTQSTFENFPRIQGWGIFSKYFFATKKITRYFCTKVTLKNIAYFVYKYNYLKCFRKCLNNVPLFIFKISSHLLHFFPLMASRTSCSEDCIGPAGLATDLNEIELIVSLVIEPLSPLFK